MRGAIEPHLRALGFEVSAGDENHLCCGSAGTYSVLQPQIALNLRDRKLAHLARLEARAILSANVGCIQHLQSGTDTPVLHWMEVLDENLIAPEQALTQALSAESTARVSLTRISSSSASEAL